LAVQFMMPPESDLFLQNAGHNALPAHLLMPSGFDHPQSNSQLPTIRPSQK
jgi:hypothetical protein